MLATPVPVSLTCARLPAPGWISPRRLLYRDKRRTCLRKGNSSLIIAKFELKPPPYPLNHRADYISIFMEKLVSWEAVGSRLEMAKAQVAEREREEERRKRAEEEELTPHSEATKMMFWESNDGNDLYSE